MWISRSEFPYGAAFGYNPSQPLVQLILDHDLGHILYDLYHVITWNKKLRLHHYICIIGFGSVRALKVGGMIAVVDSILADTGSASQSVSPYYPYILAFAQSALMAVNIQFFIVLCKKYRRKCGEHKE
ncbi:hypothetical protein FOL47_009740 [Perkinsus chesapeaki]|uniref:Uncharacterized protein n=1 Tax=Perkinsus chesapeaki TaxID=330153 RepID=A0A7J6N1P4_PERCH|nr:hypothetical protein FOL47_009740 [Perkinsus chesapeaki]